MVCLSPDSDARSLLYSASRMAARAKAELLAVYIETRKNRQRTPESRVRLNRNLALAENLGARVVILEGEKIATDLVSYAKMRGVTKIILGGKSGSPRNPWWEPKISLQVFRLSHDIDIHVVPTTDERQKVSYLPRVLQLSWATTVWSTLIVTSFTLLALGLHEFGIADASIMLTLLMAVVICAWAFGLVYSVFASILAILAHSFYFSVPIYSFAVEDPQHYAAFVFMVLVGLVVATLAQRLKLQTATSRSKEQRLEIINRFSRELSQRIEMGDVIESSQNMLAETLQTKVWILLQEQSGSWPSFFDENCRNLFNWVFLFRKKAGWSTGEMPDLPYLVRPLVGSRSVLAILVVARPPEGSFSNEKHFLVDTLSATVILALERVGLIIESRKTALEVETEKTRNILLHGLSHDLRTPLTVISATASTLLSSAETDLTKQQVISLESIEEETKGLVRQVDNLLELTKLTTGDLVPKSEWLPAEDIVFACLGRLRELFPQVQVKCQLPETLTLCFVDAPLIERALMNLLENAVVYDRNSGQIDLELSSGDRWMQIAVRDRGPGIPDEEKALVFQKFVRGSAAKQITEYRGTGLGLSIVQAVVSLHQGTFGLRDNPGGGSEFWFRIPIPAEKPQLPEETE